MIGFKRILKASCGLAVGFSTLVAPAQARFLQTDPVGYQDQMNLYAYVHNDPINNFDPNGEVTLTFGGKVHVPGYIGNAWRKLFGQGKQQGLTGGGSLSVGAAVSFPVPLIDPTAKFDTGGYIQMGAEIEGSFQLGGTGRVSAATGVHRGSVSDLAGRGAEFGGSYPTTFIPVAGIPIPNPVGPSAGVNIQFDENGRLTGVEHVRGFGSGVTSEATTTGVYSAQQGYASGDPGESRVTPSGVSGLSIRSPSDGSILCATRLSSSGFDVPC